MVTPAYYDRFRCSGGSCNDTCCKNWLIDIDKASLQKYRAHTGNLQPLFQTAIEGDDPHFRLDERGFCPFLSETGLCRIQCEMGEKALCEVCADYPRYFDKVEDVTFGGIGLGCEEAAKLILDPAADDAVPLDGIVFSSETNAALLDRFRDLLANAADWVTAWLAEERLFAEPVWMDVLDLLDGMETLTPPWRDALSRLRQKLAAVLAGREAFLARYPAVQAQLIRLARYFFYRHFWRARTFADIDTGILSEIQLAMICTLLILLLDVLSYLENGGFSFAAQVEICKQVSREIEYDDENREAVEDFLLVL